MDIYEVNIEPLQPKLKHRIIGALFVLLFYAALFFLVRFGVSVLFPAAVERQSGIDRVASEMAVTCIVWAFGMLIIFGLAGNMPKHAKRKDFKIVVDSDSIKAVYPKSLRIVRSGRIRSIFRIKASPPRPGGIGLSERGEFAARMLGSVFIPDTLPEFEQLKQLAESWRDPR